MRYLKTFESNSRFWGYDLIDKLEFNRRQELEDLTFTFLDEFDSTVGIDNKLTKLSGKSTTSDIGKKEDYLLDKNNLYESYLIQIHNTKPIKGANKIILFKELEIELIKRLLDIGYNLYYYKNNTEGYGYIHIRIYHPDDIVDKSLFLNDYKDKNLKTNEELFELLKSKFGKISNIWMSTSNNIMMDVDPFDKYDIDDLYNFLAKTIGEDFYSIEKVKNRINSEDLSLKISVK